MRERVIIGQRGRAQIKTCAAYDGPRKVVIPCTIDGAPYAMFRSCATEAEAEQVARRFVNDGYWPRQ